MDIAPNKYLHEFRCPIGRAYQNTWVLQSILGHETNVNYPPVAWISNGLFFLYVGSRHFNLAYFSGFMPKSTIGDTLGLPDTSSPL